MRPITDQEMLSALVQALVQSPNEAADAVLLDALRLGADPEKALALNALLRRRTLRGLCGVVAQYNALPEFLQNTILHNIGVLHPGLRECGRGPDPAAALAAVKLIALGRQGKLTYILSEALHSGFDAVSKAAVDAMVALARWVASESRRLQRIDSRVPIDDAAQAERAAIYAQLVEQRPEIERAVERAIDVHRGRHGQELLRAALLLADSPQSRTFAVLLMAKHGGQTAMLRRLQQAPDSEHVDAFLLAASQGGLRAHFATTLSRIDEPPSLDALLRRSHWLKDQQLQLCVHQADRGAWWDAQLLEKDVQRREADDAARIGEWIAASGASDLTKEERLQTLLAHQSGSLDGRLRLLRIALRRPMAAPVRLLRSMLADPDERLARIAARDFLRRRPPDFHNILLQVMAAASPSVRRVISLRLGQAGFDQFWERCDHLDESTRKAAGRAMLKLLPDSLQRIERRLRGGPVEQRLKAMELAGELGVADELSDALMSVCRDENPRVRSKAVAVLAAMKSVPPGLLLEQVLADSDARVRANAIEVLETKQRVEFVPLLAERARAAHNRERANAIKALHTMRVGTASAQLLSMLQDARPEHRISAMWALRQIGWWQMLHEVGRIARDDVDPRARRYALTVLRSAASMLEQSRSRAG